MAVTQETSDKLTTKDLMRSLIQSGQLDVVAQAAAAQKWLLRVANSRADYPVGWMTTIINRRSGRIRSVLKKDPVLGPNDQVLMTYRLELQSRHKNRMATHTRDLSRSRQRCSSPCGHGTASASRPP